MPGFSYDNARKQADEVAEALMGAHEGEIIAHKGQTSQASGNAMLLIKVRIDDGSKADGQEVTARITFVDTLLKSVIEKFMAALNRDPHDEFGANVIDEAFIQDWGSSLIGERIGFDVQLSKASEGYEARPEINPFSFKAAGSMQTVGGMLDADA